MSRRLSTSRAVRGALVLCGTVLVSAAFQPMFAVSPSGLQRDDGGMAACARFAESLHETSQAVSLSGKSHFAGVAVAPADHRTIARIAVRAGPISWVKKQISRVFGKKKSSYDKYILDPMLARLANQKKTPETPSKSSYDKYILEPMLERIKKSK